MTKAMPPPALNALPRNVRKLMTMLQFKRPAGSRSEALFNQRYIRSMGARPDAHGNHWLVIPGNDEIMFSSHTDTVHKTPGTQNLMYGAGALSAKDSNCLGADCGVGVWLMLEMVKARIPGTYIFHAGEEIGGIGSKAIATHDRDKLQKFKYAIALDRSGTDEIITHQYCGRTASDAFADSLAQILHPLKYEKSEYGSFTDTASYAEIIPECTNLSVGYFKQHQAHEHLDIPHAMALREALCGADWSKLSYHRDPSVKEPRVYAWGGKQGAYNGHTLHTSSRWWQDAKAKWHYGDKTANTKTADATWWESYLDKLDADDNAEDFAAYVKREHAMVAEFLEHNGFTKSDVESFIDDLTVKG